jgi:hypothetical protein
LINSKLENFDRFYLASLIIDLTDREDKSLVMKVTDDTNETKKANFDFVIDIIMNTINKLYYIFISIYFFFYFELNLFGLA